MNVKFYRAKLKALGVTTYGMKSVEDMPKSELKMIYEKITKEAQNDR
jgi:hypothetical protein